MPKAVRQFLLHSRKSMIKPVGMGFRRTRNMALMPLSVMRRPIAHSLGVVSGRGALLLSDGLSDTTNLEQTGGMGMVRPLPMPRKIGLAKPAFLDKGVKGMGFGVSSPSPNLLEKLESLSLKGMPRKKNIKLTI